MAFRDGLVAHVAESALLPGLNVPVYFAQGRKPGNPCFGHEQRVFLAAAGIKHVEFRSQERKRGILPLILAENNLPATDFLPPETGAARHDPALLSSRCLVAWLTQRWNMAPRESCLHSSNERATCGVWARMLSSLEAACTATCADAERLPVIRYCGVELQVRRNGSVDTITLVERTPSMLADWHQLARAGRHLRPWPGGEVSLVELWKFISLRLRAGRVPADHPFRGLQRCLLAVIVWMTEVHVHTSIRRTMAKYQGKTMPLAEIYGKSGRWRVHTRLASRIQLLQHCSAAFGSDEAVAGAHNAPNGLAAQMRAVRNSVYDVAVRRAFAQSTCVHFGHDGSTHGGPEVICGYLFDPVANLAAYAKPEVVRPLPVAPKSEVSVPPRWRP